MQRHRYRDQLYKITDNSLARLCLRAGIERKSNLTYEQIRYNLKNLLTELIRDSAQCAEFASTKTIEPHHVILALSSKGTHVTYSDNLVLNSFRKGRTEEED